MELVECHALNRVRFKFKRVYVIFYFVYSYSLSYTLTIFTDRECPELEQPSLGQVVLSGRHFGGRATYTCPHGYHVVGLGMLSHIDSLHIKFVLMLMIGFMSL